MQVSQLGQPTGSSRIDDLIRIRDWIVSKSPDLAPRLNKFIDFAEIRFQLMQEGKITDREFWDTIESIETEMFDIAQDVYPSFVQTSIINPGIGVVLMGLFGYYLLFVRGS